MGSAFQTIYRRLPIDDAQPSSACQTSRPLNNIAPLHSQLPCPFTVSLCFSGTRLLPIDSRYLLYFSRSVLLSFSRITMADVGGLTGTNTTGTAAPLTGADPLSTGSDPTGTNPTGGGLPGPLGGAAGGLPNAGGLAGATIGGKRPWVGSEARHD